MPVSTYHVEFDTLDMPERIVATRVRLDKHVVRNMDAPMNVALCDDPLYEKLERYVLANPSRKRQLRRA